MAGFLGSPKMNFVKGRLERQADGAALTMSEQGLRIALPAARPCAGRDGDEIILGLRPEHVSRANSATPADDHARVEATIELVQPTGSRSYASFRLADQPIVAELQAHDVSRAGEKIRVDINLGRAALFNSETGRAL